MSKLLLTLICLLVPPSAHEHGTGEAAPDARARYEVIAGAVALEAGDDATLAAFLLTVAHHESSFRSDIHSGDKLGDGGLAWGLFQVHPEDKRANDPTAPLRRSEHVAGDLVGTGAAPTRRAVKVTASYLRPYIRGCRADAMCVFLAYGGIARGRFDTLPAKVKARLYARVKTYQRLVLERHRRRAKK